MDGNQSTPKPWRKAVAVMLLIAACGDAASPTPVPVTTHLAETTAAEFEAHLEGLDRPAVVNVWASWCLPCRAEAPLLNLAFEKYASQIEFFGVGVQDTPAGAQAFLDEFGLPFQHFSDKNRRIANHYGGIGTPITLFFGPRGELVTVHNGIVDERTLAMNIDELLHLGG